MKLIINVEKKHAYFIVAALVLLSSLIFVIGTGYTTGTPSHTTLFTDIIKGKSGAIVSVMDNVGIGTTSPRDKLHIYDSGVYATMLIDSSNVFIPRGFASVAKHI